MNRWRLIGLSVGTGLVMMIVVLFGVRGVATAVGNAEQDKFVYLPIIEKPDIPVIPTETLKNGSFENGWTDMPPAPGFLINQQPNDWTLSWIEIGDPLYDAPDGLATGVPECIHKLQAQLPEDEWVGGANALILEGTHTYKIFNSGAKFGAQLTQTLTNLPISTTWRLTVPMLAIVEGDQSGDPYASETGAWVNGQGDWVNWVNMGGTRTWYEHVVEFTVPEDGQVDILIRVKSKYQAPADFFIDNIRLEHIN